MTELTKNYHIGDKALFKGEAENYLDKCPLVRNDEGVVVQVLDNSVILDFGPKGQWNIRWWDLAPWVDIENMNPLQKIRWDYEEWVDDVSRTCDWKTNFGIDEIQAKYSGLALGWVVKELEDLGTEESLKRAKYLKTLY